MGLNISAENAKLWISEKDGRNGGKWKQCSVGISSKIDDKWVNTYMKAAFSGKLGIDVNTLTNGAVFDFSGFLTVDKPWKDKYGREHKDPMIMITEANFYELPTPQATEELQRTGFAEVEDPVPF